MAKNKAKKVPNMINYGNYVNIKKIIYMLSKILRTFKKLKSSAMI